MRRAPPPLLASRLAGLFCLLLVAGCGVAPQQRQDPPQSGASQVADENPLVTSVLPGETVVLGLWFPVRVGLGDEPVEIRRLLSTLTGQGGLISRRLSAAGLQFEYRIFPGFAGVIIWSPTDRLDWVLEQLSGAQFALNALGTGGGRRSSWFANHRTRLLNLSYGHSAATGTHAALETRFSLANARVSAVGPEGAIRRVRTFFATKLSPESTVDQSRPSVLEPPSVYVERSANEDSRILFAAPITIGAESDLAYADVAARIIWSRLAHGEGCEVGDPEALLSLQHFGRDSRLIVELPCSGGGVERFWTHLSQTWLDLRDFGPKDEEIVAAMRLSRNAYQKLWSNRVERTVALGGLVVHFGRSDASYERALRPQSYPEIRSKLDALFGAAHPTALMLVPKSTGTELSLYQETLSQAFRSGFEVPLESVTPRRIEIDEFGSVLFDAIPNAGSAHVNIEFESGLETLPASLCGAPFLGASLLSYGIHGVQSSVSPTGITWAWSGPPNELNSVFDRLAARLIVKKWPNDIFQSARREAEKRLNEIEWSTFSWVNQTLSRASPSRSECAQSLSQLTGPSFRGWFSAYVLHQAKSLVVTGQISADRLKRRVSRLGTPGQNFSRARSALLSAKVDMNSVSQTPKSVLWSGINLSQAQREMLGVIAEHLNNQLGETASVSVAHYGPLTTLRVGRNLQEEASVQLARLRRSAKLSDAEFEEARDRRMARMTLQFEDGVSRASWFQRQRMFADGYRGRRAIRQWRTRVEGMTRSEVNRFLARWFLTKEPVGWRARDRRKG